MGAGDAVKLSGGEAVVRALEAHGVELVFGIPGTHSLAIYKHLGRSQIRHVLPRHEQGAGFAADGYARASGRPGVCIVTSGPGVTNIATAAAEAHADSVPMLIISPGMPTDVYRRDVGYLHEAKDQSRAMDSLVAWSHRAVSPSDVLTTIDRAFWEFASCRPRPVHLEIPLDVLDAEEDVSLSAPTPAALPDVSRASIQVALGILEGAARPGLLVGGGAQGAAGAVRHLAQRLGAIVVTTATGKGAFPEDDELAVGATLNYRATREALAACDALLAVGTELSDVDLEDGKLVVPGRVIRIDIDSGQLNKNLTADCAIHADAAVAIGHLLAGLKPRDRVAGAERAHEARSRLAGEVEAKAAGMLQVVGSIQRCLDDDTIVVCDNSMLCYYGVIPALRLKTPRTCLNPTGYATLGYALPAGIGAKLAQPERRVVVVTGDGGLMFTLSELATAVEERLQLAIVVANNHGYGEIRAQMATRGIEPVGVSFDPPDFALVAKAFGAQGAVASDAMQLEGAIRAAYQRPGPTLIEIPG
jgi:thiamine pyrophosphate-dependent acetolactate synthase large subunit-like protein